MKKFILRSFLVLFLLHPGKILKGQEGSLDSSFGNFGKVTTLIANEYGSIDAMALQPDGKLVVAASNATNNFSYEQVRVVRYNPNGSIDSAFANNGIYKPYIGNDRNDGACAVIIQPDNKILIGGVTSVSIHDRIFLIRLNSNGTPDNSFGINGKVITQLATEEVCYCMALQPDGKIIVGGAEYGGGNGRGLVLRFNSNGSIDNTFQKFLAQAVPSEETYFSSVKLQPDGNIVAVGTIVSTTGKDEILLLRLSSTGTLDNTFGVAGKVIATFDKGCERIHDMAIQTDGKIILAGEANFSAWEMILLRYTNSGELDTTFGTRGLVYVSNLHSQIVATSVAIQKNGKILMAGGVALSTTDFALRRFTNSGIPDSSFGTGGKVYTDFSDSSDGASAMVIQANGKIVLAGGSGPGYALARYNSDVFAIDAGVSDLLIPASRCGTMGNNQSVGINITNYGKNPILPNAVYVNLNVSGGNTGNYNSTNSGPININSTSTLTFNSIDLTNLGNNIFTATINYTGDLDPDNNSIKNYDTAFTLKPIVSFNITNNANTYSFVPAVLGKPPINYQWDFGDGSPTSSLQNPTHHYASIGAYPVQLKANDACGSDTVTQIINISTGLNNVITYNSFMVYPNPADNELIIEHAAITEQNVEIVIYDYLGRKLIRTINKDIYKISLDLSLIPDGIYFLEINNVVRKIKVQHI
jgi:uncharacterized delta-60 repeat protein